MAFANNLLMRFNSIVSLSKLTPQYFQWNLRKRAQSSNILNAYSAWGYKRLARGRKGVPARVFKRSQASLVRSTLPRKKKQKTRAVKMTSSVKKVRRAHPPSVIVEVVMRNQWKVRKKRMGYKWALPPPHPSPPRWRNLTTTPTTFRSSTLTDLTVR